MIETLYRIEFQANTNDSGYGVVVAEKPEMKIAIKLIRIAELP